MSDPRKRIQELLSRAHSLLIEAREVAEQQGLSFSFGTMGWSPYEDNLPESIEIEWQPSGGMRC